MAAFKSLPMSKLIHLALVTEIPASKINFLTKKRWNLYGKRKIQKLKIALKIVLYVMTAKMVD